MATLERAIEIAAPAHKGVSDKSGAPYILHPLRGCNGKDTLFSTSAERRARLALDVWH